MPETTTLFPDAAARILRDAGYEARLIDCSGQRSLVVMRRSDRWLIPVETLPVAPMGATGAIAIAPVTRLLQEARGVGHRH